MHCCHRFFDRLKITEADLYHIFPTMHKKFIVKALAVANPVSLFVANKQWHKNKVDSRRIQQLRQLRVL